MITTLGQWPIGVQILLILSLVVILSRLVTLIALVVSRNWYAVLENRTAADARNRHLTGLGVNVSETDVLEHPDVVAWLEHHNLLDNPQYESSSTGFTPGGVGFTLAESPSRRTWFQRDNTAGKFRHAKARGGSFKPVRRKRAR